MAEEKSKVEKKTDKPFFYGIIGFIYLLVGSMILCQYGFSAWELLAIAMVGSGAYMTIDAVTTPFFVRK